MTNFKVKYLFEERRKNNPVKLGTCINHDLFPRQGAFMRARDCETFMQFFIEKQEDIQNSQGTY